MYNCTGAGEKGAQGLRTFLSRFACSNRASSTVHLVRLPCRCKNTALLHTDGCLFDKDCTILPCKYVLARGDCWVFTNLGVGGVEELCWLSRPSRLHALINTLRSISHDLLLKKIKYSHFSSFWWTLLQNWTYRSETWQSFQCMYLPTPRNVISRTISVCLKKIITVHHPSTL